MSSPKRLQIAGNSGGDFNANALMTQASERYSFGKTQRNSCSVQNKYPPKLSPRASNKSVDPATRKMNILSKMNSQMKTTGGFVGGGASTSISRMHNNASSALNHTTTTSIA